MDRWSDSTYFFIFQKMERFYFFKLRISESSTPGIGSIIYTCYVLVDTSLAGTRKWDYPALAGVHMDPGNLRDKNIILHILEKFHAQNKSYSINR